MKLSIQIAAGIIIAAIAIAFGSRLYAEAELQAAADALTKVKTDAARAAAVEQSRLDAQLIRQRAKANEIAETQAKAAWDAKQTAKRKEEAWSNFFIPSKDCEHPADWQMQVQCGNAYMKARREFEGRWAANR